MLSPEQIAIDFVRSPANRKRLADLIVAYGATQQREAFERAAAICFGDETGRHTAARLRELAQGK